jgi:hypothetical protein
MRLCIFGRFDLNGSFVNGSFGGKLTTTFPSQKPHIGILCIPAVGRTTSVQYLSYEGEDLQFAQGLCTWLSCRTENFRQITTFEVKIFDPSVKDTAREFINELFLSPASQLKSSLDIATGIGRRGSLDGSLLDFAASLKSKAMALFRQSEMHCSLDYYDSALQALSGWARSRQPKSIPSWKRLYFGILVGRLQVLLDQDGGIRSYHAKSLDHALSWAYEEVTVDGAIQKLILDAEVVEFLQVYARVEEKWGRDVRAFILLSAGLHFGVEKEQIQVQLRRLGPVVTHSVAKAISTFPNVFQGLYEANVDSSEFLETSSEGECSICISRFSVGERVDLIKKCGHRYHSNCIHAWVATGGWECPLCRGPVN